MKFVCHFNVKEGGGGMEKKSNYDRKDQYKGTERHKRVG
jgi:hypothetical protein